MASRGLAVVLAENLCDSLELNYPRLRMEEAGYDVKVAGLEKGAAYMTTHVTACEVKASFPVTADLAFGDVDPAEMKVLVIPGGYGPDRLRRYPECLELVSKAWEGGAVLAVICHGGWVLASAGIVKGRRLTSLPAIKDDMINAGAEWVDEPCVVDGRLVSAQMPRDLPAFMKAVLGISQ